MTALETLQRRIQKRVAETRARVSECFVPFDRHNRKKITFSQAVRALNTFLNLALSKEEVSALSEYNTADGLFQYKLFCDDVDTIFTTPGLELAPDTVPLNPLSGTRLREFGSALTMEESEDLAAALEACAEQVATRGVLVKAFFSDFDRHNNGFVSRPQFEREIRSCFPFLGGDDVDVLAKHYGDGKDVNYRALHLDVTPDAVRPGVGGGAGGGGGATTAGARGRARMLGGGHVDVEAVEARMIRDAATRRIRTKEFFVEYDPLRSGHITASQFQRALYSCKFSQITDGELKAVAAKYANPARGGAIRYVDFLDALDTAFTVKGLEKAPTATTDTFARTIATAPRRAAPAMSDSDAELLDATMAEIARVIAERRIELVPLFKDFDRSNEEYVSKDQFMRVLRGENLLPATASAIKVLNDRFEGSGDRAGRIDWRTFYNLVDPKPAPRTEPTFTRTTITRPKSDVAEVMHRIKATVVRDKIRVEEFLRDSDKLRKGFVSKHQLEVGLAATGLGLSFEDVDALAEAYEDPRAKDPTGQPMVAWRRLCDDVNLVSTRPGLELDPSADVGATVEMARTGRLGLPSASAAHAAPRGDLAGGHRLSPRSAERLKELLKDLEYIVSTRRIELIPAFQDFDRHKRGVISSSQFARAMDRIGLSLDADDLTLVVAAFRVPTADRSELNYQWFVHAIDAADGFVGDLPGAKEPPTAAGATLRRTGGLSGTGTIGTGSGAAATADRRRMPDLSGPSVDAEDVIDKLKLSCAQRGMKLKDFFVDYDRLRSGHLHKSKFRTALATAKLDLAHQELNALEAAFRNVRMADHVNWRDLSHEVDGGNEGLEKLPSGTVTRKMGKRRTDVVGARAGAENDAVDGIVAGVASVVRTRRVNLKPRFADYDPLRSMHVTKNRFCSVLQTEKLVDGDKDLATLCKAFEVVGLPDKVNYSKFLLAVDGTLTQ